MEAFTVFIATIAANVISYYICKHFCSNESKQINYRHAQIKLALPIDIAFISNNDSNAPYIDEEGYDV